MRAYAAPHAAAGSPMQPASCRDSTAPGPLLLHQVEDIHFFLLQKPLRGAAWRRGGVQQGDCQAGATRLPAHAAANRRSMRWHVSYSLNAAIAAPHPSPIIMSPHPRLPHAQIRRILPYLQSSHGGLTCSGGEPLLQPQFVAALFQEAHAMGLSTTLDTTGQVRRGARPLSSQAAFAGLML